MVYYYKLSEWLKFFKIITISNMVKITYIVGEIIKLHNNLGSSKM